jgi:hypothetical protein
MEVYSNAIQGVGLPSLEGIRLWGILQGKQEICSGATFRRSHGLGRSSRTGTDKEYTR